MAAISVAMCTYNGAAYLQTQLDSIAAQTTLPDELVVCDDVSTDETTNIVESFARTAKFEVRLVRNAINLRSTANFAQAISLCRGDIIALCDQDDYWHSEKLATMAREFAAHLAAGMVFSNLEIVDDSLKPLGYTAWDSNLFTPARQRSVVQGDAARVLLAFNVATGAAMAFRREFKDLLLPIPSGWVHDAWIALLLAAVAPVRIIDRPLVDYRQHASQQIGLRRLGFVGLFRKAIAMRKVSFQEMSHLYQSAYDRLVEYPGVNREFLQQLSLKVEHLLRRHRMRRERLFNIGTIFRELRCGNYDRYSFGWRSALHDVFF